MESLSINDGGGGKINGSMPSVASAVVHLKNFKKKKKNNQLRAAKAAASSNQRANIAMVPNKTVCSKCKKPGHTASSCYKGTVCSICGKEHPATACKFRFIE